MKFKIFLYLCFLSTSVLAQIKTSELYGSWIATRVTYLSGEELPDENILKYTYVKYNFKPTDKMFYSGVYYNLGWEMFFNVVGDRINVSSSAGTVVNVFKVLDLKKSTLVIVQSTAQGFTDPMAIKYTFTREEILQDAMPLTNADVFRINGTDTLYQSGQKIYAQFSGPDFSDYISANMGKREISVKSGELLVSFIVDKDGVADSLKILQGINPKYDKAYVEIFNSAKHKWSPARINGKPVSVLMQQEKKYFTSDKAIPSYFEGNKANLAYNNGNYELALHYYNLALGSKPDDKEQLYKRGICKQKLGNLNGACEDWRKVKALGGEEANALLEKFCK
ncbi:hypothetical protein [Pedobacter frigoris]|uniref:hypothetical protein n=1 Tax=Pedobacter frigoris TaxID=2571272 RepID=UPI00292E6CAC|nr:hypothetical protein [Pedobacter frigoris]